MRMNACQVSTKSEQLHITFHKVRCPAATSQELLQFFVLDAGEDRRVADLEAIEMQDWQHRSIADWVEELVGLPRRGQRSSFSLSIADDAGDGEIGIVEDSPEGMAE